jgi:hypothetical protein
MSRERDLPYGLDIDSITAQANDSNGHLLMELTLSQVIGLNQGYLRLGMFRG